MSDTGKLPTSKAKTAYGLLSEIRKLILEEPLRYAQETVKLASLHGKASKGFSDARKVDRVAGVIDPTGKAS